MAFLQSMLSRDRVFKTAVFTMFETHARDNMAAELAEIQAELDLRESGG